jgi:glycosyltransferase involved in cell wall biosynthesis
MATAVLQSPKTAFLPASIDACAMYRMYLPHLRIPDSLFLFRMERLDLRELQEYEVIVVQRQVTPQNYMALKKLKDYGKKLIYDLDDDVWSLPASNPAQQMFKMVENGFGECMKWVDVITVSTQTLKGVVTAKLPHLKQEVLVTPNAIDFDLFQPSTLERDDDKVILGWAGSNTHDGDMTEISSVIPDLLKKYPKLYVEFVGGAAPKRLRGMDRVTSRPWVPVGEFANRFSSWSWDISMAPLNSIRFNNSKSNIKMLESAAVGIPCVVSNVRPYYEFCSLGGKELEWLLCDTTRDWKTKLEKLIEEPAYRKEVAELMYATARKYFSIDTIAENWKYAARKAAGRN